MMRRFEVLTTIHVGPLQRNINTGDIIWWDQSTSTLMINGEVLKEAKNMKFEEAVGILERQMKKFPEKPWAKELSPVDVTKSQINSKAKIQDG